MTTVTAPRIAGALTAMLDTIIAPGARQVGVDAVDIDAIARQLEAGGPKLAERWFTDREMTFAAGDNDRLATTLAGKEAVAKVLGTGIRGPVRWRTIEITRRADGAPVVILHAGARDRAQSLGIAEINVSLCHESTMALAAAIAVPAGSSV